MRFRAFPAIALLVCASEAAAQKPCTKGVPCGDTCVAANKTCRVDAPSTVTPAATLQTTPVPQPSPLTFQYLSAGDVAMRAGFVAGKLRVFHTTPDMTAPWVGGVNGLTYYRRDCSAVRGVLPGGYVFFKTEADAFASAYRRSIIPGC